VKNQIKLVFITILIFSFAANLKVFANKNYSSALGLDFKQFDKLKKSKGAFFVSGNLLSSLINYESPNLVKSNKLSIKQSIGFGVFWTYGWGGGRVIRSNAEFTFGSKNLKFAADLGLGVIMEGKIKGIQRPNLYLIPTIFLGIRKERKNDTFFKVGATFPTLLEVSFGKYLLN